MSGLTQRTQAGQSGLVAPKVDFQRFTTAGTDDAGWVKPADVSIVWIECYGAGGGGGGGAGQISGTDPGGAGGGGGAMAWACFSADALPATLDIIVGAGGNAGTGGSSGYGANGTAGGDTEVHVSSGLTEAGKILLKAYGGGFGGPAFATGQEGRGGGGAGGNRAGGAGGVPGGGGGAGAGNSGGNGGAGGAGGKGECRIWSW